jgi:hypothetical protein
MRVAHERQHALAVRLPLHAQCGARGGARRDEVQRARRAAGAAQLHHAHALALRQVRGELHRMEPNRDFQPGCITVLTNSTAISAGFGTVLNNPTAILHGSTRTLTSALDAEASPPGPPAGCSQRMALPAGGVVLYTWEAIGVTQETIRGHPKRRLEVTQEAIGLTWLIT